MIALLRGTVAHATPARVVLDVNGVGYLVHVTARLGAELSGRGEGEPLTLHVSTLVREDAITLYGFPTVEERDAFDLLREVSGIGPRHALSLLGVLAPDELAAAIARGDERALTRAPGVGRRTAGRILLELKDKLPATFRPTAPAAPRAADPLPLALARLDYRKSEIDRALASPEVPAAGEAPLEDRLRAAITVLSRPA